LPSSWTVPDVAHFNRDGHPDYVLLNPVSHQIVIAYLSGPTVIDAALEPTLLSGFDLWERGRCPKNAFPTTVMIAPHQ
ncbi:MAG TPA: hypothetical protein VIR01_21435, partial [Pyrinomonadaceae bacterium]